MSHHPPPASGVRAPYTTGNPAPAVHLIIPCSIRMVKWERSNFRRAARDGELVTEAVKAQERICNRPRRERGSNPPHLARRFVCGGRGAIRSPARSGGPKCCRLPHKVRRLEPASHSMARDSGGGVALFMASPRQTG